MNTNLPELGFNGLGDIQNNPVYLIKMHERCITWKG